MTPSTFISSFDACVGHGESFVSGGRFMVTARDENGKTYTQEVNEITDTHTTKALADAANERKLKEYVSRELPQKVKKPGEPAPRLTLVGFKRI